VRGSVEAKVLEWIKTWREKTDEEISKAIKSIEEDELRQFVEITNKWVFCNLFFPFFLTKYTGRSCIKC